MPRRSNKRSITPTLLEWRRLSLQAQALDKWKGDLPQYMGGGTPIPFIQVNPKQ